MINGIEVKVCGLTRLIDASAAAALGADFLGFIFYPDSPRNLELDDFHRLLPDLPSLPKVAVTVSPEDALLDSLVLSGVDFFQIHFVAGKEPEERLRYWSERLGPEKLWLAPKIAPGESIDEGSMELAKTWLWDTYRKEGFGGSGKTGDWEAFRAISSRYPEKKWILAGGLGPENVVEAIAQSGAKGIDLNSGLERSPGIKDKNKMDRLRAALEFR